MADYDLPDWVQRLRLVLGDTTLPYLWDDATLETCITQAVAAHSYLFPCVLRWTWDLAASDQDVSIWPQQVAPATPATIQAARVVVPSSGQVADILGVLGVEVPMGTPIPQVQALTTTRPQPSSASRGAQGYSWWPWAIHLRVAITGGGTTKMLAYIAQTWYWPLAAQAWNGPQVDVPLILLLARRAAYQILSEWQARTQGIGTPAIAGTSTNVHIDIPPLLVALEIEIARELELRAPRRVVLPPIPAGT